MFKIESYITPILLSYVDKYVRDFHPADSQVSLWSGGVALHNLVLKPEVLQKEFNLPFVLTSGRIHELLIQVPWMKIISEPIVVTINTIECVLTLKEKSDATSTSPPAVPVEEMVETPPSYTQSLIRKIVGNIAIRCHHLILKYVEDDIVVSVNIKYLSMDSAGENWEPMFAEISPIDLVMRKVIKLNDLTLCLDKRNAAGKIETYQEPLLYRCELEFRVLTKFTSITLKRPLYTHMSVIGERLEFSLSCQQLPMMYRLMVFIKALKNREVKVRQQEDEGQRRASDALNPDMDLSNQGWTAWAWSFVPTFSGAVSGSDILNDYSFKRRAPTLITSIDITQISILFKVPEIDEYPSLYGGLRKVRQQNVCELVLEELKCQSTVMGVERFTWRAGFKSIKLLSEGACTCGVSDYNDRLGQPTIYLKSTTAESNESTLPWPLDTEFSRTIPRLENKELLAVSPAFAMEYVHVVNISDSCEDLCSFDGDFEYSNFEERSDISVVFGQIELLICAGLVHRLTTLKAAIDTYDYPPYAKAAKDPKPHELHPVTIEEKEALMSGVPLRRITLYAEKPCIKFAVWDHASPAKTNFDMDVQQTMPQIGIKSRKLSSAKLDEARNQYFDCIKNMPIMALQPRRLYIDFTLPVYPKRLVYATCQYSEPNTYLMENCYRNLNVKFSDMRYFLIYPNETDSDLQEVECAESEAEEKSHSTNQESSTTTEKLLPHVYWKKSKGAQTTTMAQFDGKILIKQLELPEYFINIKEPLQSSCTLQIKELLVCTTMAKLLTAYYIVLGSHPIFNQPIMKSPLYTMSLVRDSIEEKEMVYLDTEIDDISFKIFHSSNSHTYIGSIKAVRILALESMSSDVKRVGKNKQAWIFSAPDSESNGTFLKCSLQYCDQLTASSISYFGLWTEGVSISFDPLLSQWLTYSPQPFERPKVNLPPRIRTIPSSNFFLRRLSDDMQSNPTRPLTKTHSSSDKDYVHGTHSHANSSTAQNAEQPAVENKSVGTDVTRSPKWFRDLFGKLRNFSIHCDIGMITIFFPLETVPAEECPSLYETIENSIKRKDQSYQNKVMVLSLARIDLHSSSAKKVIWQQIRLDRPTTLNDDMRHILSQSFPWKLVFNNLSCYTLTRKSAFSKKSQLKQDMVKTVVLNLVTSVVTISIVTKHKNEKQVIPKPKATSERRKSTEKSDQVTHFAPVVDFKPNSLREFLRGSNRPADHKSPPEKRTDDTRIFIEDDTASIDSSTGIVQESPTMQKSNLVESLALEDITHLGLCVHVDTTPLNIGINEDQIFMAVSVLHGLNDVINCILSKNDTVKSDFYSRTDNTVGSESIHDSIYSTTGHDSYHRSIEELSSKCGMTENYTDAASTSEKLKTSPGLTTIFDRKSTGEQQTDSFQDVKVTFWMQWIISHFSVNCFAQKDPLASWTPDMKLAFHADDIIASLDVQDDYMKLKLKVSSAVMRHYKRDKKGSWVPGDFFGFIVRGNEKPAKRSEDFGFIGLTLTRANSNSLKSRWHDETLTVGKQKKSDSKARNITEIVLTLQSLEAILSMTTLEIFASTLSPLFLAIDCVQPSTYLPREEAIGASGSTSSHPSLNSEKWNSQHYPLCYFDCNNVRVLLPANELIDHDSKQDVLVFEIGAICLTPNAENPICRQPLRPELYEKAARANMLGLPGSDLEDRQYQLLIRDLKVNTGLWFELTKGYSEEATPSLIQENPAVEWNAQKEVSPSCESYKPIINKLDICLVIALAMFHSSNLVCGPSVEFNIVSDVDIYLCTTQLEVITKLMEESSRLLQKIKQCSGNVASQRGYESKKGTIICPYSKYFYQPYAPRSNSVVTFQTPAEKSSQVDNPILPTAEKLKHQDSGVDSASSTPPFCKKKLESYSVVLKTVNTAKIPREEPEHFDLYMTAGKITVNVYSSIIPMESKGSQISLKLVDPQPVATSSKHTESVVTHNFTPVVYLQLHQPNVFYSRQNTKCKTQLSIFDIWIGLGDKATELLPAIQDYNITLFETRKGSVDPETGVPPALFTLKINSDTKKKMNLTILVDRPVKFTLCHDRCRRVRDSVDLILQETIHKFSTIELFYTEELSAESSFKAEKFNSKNAAVWKWKEYFSQFDYIDLNMTQTLISMKTKVQDVFFGLSSLTCSVVVASRPDQITCLAVVDSLVLSANSCDGKRKYVLKPFTFGSEVRVCWETWQKTEFSCYHMRPTVYILVDSDILVLDLRPQNIITFYMLSEEFSRINNVLNQVYASNVGIRRIKLVHKFESEVSIKDPFSNQSIREAPSDVLLQEHHYKDDLRIGAFKVVEGGQLPMAYQVIVGTYTMCWRYPHPRAITRILCFPLPFQETISPVCVSCVLEYYCEQTECFEPYTFFELTEDTGVKVDLFTQLPNVVFASTWRVSIIGSEKHDEKRPNITFDAKRFMRSEFMSRAQKKTQFEDEEEREDFIPITAATLAASLRIDSYFAPNDIARTYCTLRSAGVAMNFYNLVNNEKSLSTAAVKSYIVLSAKMSSSISRAQIYSQDMVLMGWDTEISLDILNVGNLLMVPMVGKFPMRLTSFRRRLSQYDVGYNIDARIGDVAVALGPAHIQNLHILLNQWMHHFQPVQDAVNHSTYSMPSYDLWFTSTYNEPTCAKSMIKYIIHNSTNMLIRIGQDETDQSIMLEAGVKYDYHWHSVRRKELFRIATQDGDWCWSRGFGIDYPGLVPVNLDPDSYGCGMRIFVLVENVNSVQRTVTVMGRLVVWNMVNQNFILKIYEKSSDTDTVQRAPMLAAVTAESPSSSIVLNAFNDVMMKVKFANFEAGWSGEIPLKECPRQNVPWLVKVPSADDMEFVSIWCRVVKSQNHGRLLVILWPLYIINSHLPLDVDMSVTTEGRETPLLFPVEGRGKRNHFFCPGTTATKHNLSFQFKNIESKITVNSVPLHYGVTQKSIFDKPMDTDDVDLVVSYLKKWLEKEKDSWPYSCIQSDLPMKWTPIVMQPNTDITVRYLSETPYICSLIVDVAPWGLLANCSSITITLRNTNFSIVCRVKNGMVVSPPSSFVNGPFYLCIESSKKQYVSEPLKVTNNEAGPYQKMPSGVLAVDNHTNTIIFCDDKICPLSLFYEIKHNINVFGVACTYVFTNHLDEDIALAPIAISSETECCIEAICNSFKIIPANRDNSPIGVPIKKFDLMDTCDDYTSSTPKEFFLYLCLGLHGKTHVEFSCPIRVDQHKHRRCLTLNAGQSSVPVVLTMQEFRGQVFIGLHEDPAPEFLICNNTKLQLFVAQVSNEYLASLEDRMPTTSQVTIIPECEILEWYCKLKDHSSVYYSTPSYCNMYPQIKPKGSVPGDNMSTHLTFCHVPEDQADYRNMIWCPPVNVGMSTSEQFVKLPNQFLDMKVTVKSHLHTSVITMEHVTENDISASDIRKRLSDGSAFGSNTIDDSFIPVPSAKSDNILLDRVHGVSAIMAGRSCSDESDVSELNLLIDDDNTSNERKQELPEMMSIVDVKSFEPISVMGLTVLNKNKPLTLNLLIDKLEFSMMAEKGSEYSLSGGPVLVLTCDHIMLSVEPSAHHISWVLAIGDIQIDNPRHRDGSFDFPVVLMGQTMSLIQKDRFHQHWAPLWNTFGEEFRKERIRLNSMLTVTLVKCKWSDIYGKRSGLSGLTIQTAPVLLYIEDKYVSFLLEYAVDLMLPNTPTRHSNDDCISTDMTIVPSALILESQAIAFPLRLEKFQISPLNILLSVHTSVRLYIALDHSPLQFDTFERTDMTTSLYHLGHTLTMHYLSGAIFGAGWVVGSLEILGSPSGLVRRVGAGLRDLVLEPWRGLAVGPRALLSGAAAGSASLARQLTQGTVQSVSMVCGSVARNLDLLALDAEHAERATEQRRRRPSGLADALVRGLSGLAVSLLGAVGGIAHHPIVSPTCDNRLGPSAVAAGFTRGLIGAVAKPLSATADLLALAGQGLLSQAGWDVQPQARGMVPLQSTCEDSQDNVRWAFRLSDLEILCTCSAMHNHKNVIIIITDKWFVMVDPSTDKITEMMDLKLCTVKDVQNDGNLEVEFAQVEKPVVDENLSEEIDDMDDYQVNYEAMQRVAKYAGLTDHPVSSNSVQFRLNFSEYHVKFFKSIFEAAKTENMDSGYNILD